MKTSGWMVAGRCPPGPQGRAAVGESCGDGDGHAAAEEGGELATMDGGGEALGRATPQMDASGARATAAGRADL